MKIRNLMPEGPAAVNLGKDFRISMISTSRYMLTGTADGTGCIGIGPWGCFDSNNFQVSGMFGAIPEDVSTWHALE